MSREGAGIEIPADGRVPVRLRVNGSEHELDVEPGLLLIHLLRDRLRLKGTHVGCLTGDCGACTVRFNGRIAKACTILAGTAFDSDVTTIEGIGTLGTLHPVQQAFWDMHGFQCGFCLPGMIFAAIELLDEKPSPDEAEVRRALSGTLCRCTGYQSQVAAVLAAAQKLQESRS